MQQSLTIQFTMSEVNIGSLISKPELFKKDAIHMATVQIQSADRFLPGEHVGLNKQGEAVQVDDPIGIVDPFLAKPVEPGDVFWLWIYPKTINNLRHDWNHPVLDEVEKAKRENELPTKRNSNSNTGWILPPIEPVPAAETQPVTPVITNPEEDLDDGCSGC